MRLILTLIAIIQVCYAQKPSLSFDTKPFDAIDQWVILNKTENDPNYMLGFVYIDPQAGFTFNFQGQLEIGAQDLILLPRLDTSNIIMRLDRKTADLAILNDTQKKQLKLPDQPDWLVNYKLNEEFIDHRLGIGSALNAIGASHKALPILQKAYEEDPHYQGLEFELAYAYNATGSYYKALIILNKAIENEPSNFWYYRELGFSFKHLNNLEEAEKTYLKGIELTSDNFQKAEMAINMLQSYFHNKNRLKFDQWKKLVETYSEPNSVFLEYLIYFEDNWSK